MAKRFTDTDKWDKKWFRKLGSRLRDLRQYMLDKCDHAGVIEIDLETFAHFIGEEVSLDDVQKAFRNEIQILNDEKVFLSDFIEFQYKCIIKNLNPENKVHKSVIERLKAVGAYKPLPSPLQGTKDKDKDKNKDKNKDKEFENCFQYFQQNVEKCTGIKPTKGQKAKERFDKIVEEGDFEDFARAVKNYCLMLAADNTRTPKKSLETFIGTKQSGFYWRDWIDYTPSQMNLTKNQQSTHQANMSQAERVINNEL